MAESTVVITITDQAAAATARLLSRVPALHAVGHLADYFGPWAMEPVRLQAAAQYAGRLDLAAHVREQLRRESAASDPAPGVAAGSPGSAPTGFVRVASGYDYSLGPDGVAVVELVGTMMKGESSLGQSTSTVMLRRTLRAAMADDRVRGAILHIDSPGGTVAGTHDLAADVRAFAAVKPITAYIDGLGASAAYWVASQATQVAAGPDALVGSIGTYATVVDSAAAAEKDGFKVHVIKAGQFKGAGTPGAPVTDEQLAEFQRIVDGLNTMFLEGVSAGRRMALSRVAELADGRVHKAGDALKLGLIDQVASLDIVMADLSAAINQPSPLQKPKGPAMTPGTSDTAIQPKAATLADLKAQFPRSNADFRETCLEKGLTLEQAAVEYGKARDAELDAERAKSRAGGVKPLPSGAGGAAETAGDPIAGFKAVVAANIAAGQSRAKAWSNAGRDHPELREAFVEAYNAMHRKR